VAHLTLGTRQGISTSNLMGRPRNPRKRSKVTCATWQMPVGHPIVPLLLRPTGGDGTDAPALHLARHHGSPHRREQKLQHRPSALLLIPAPLPAFTVAFAPHAGDHHHSCHRLNDFPLTLSHGNSATPCHGRESPPSSQSPQIFRSPSCPSSLSFLGTSKTCPNTQIRASLSTLSPISHSVLISTPPSLSL
jgi:hypothetical protein